MSAAPDLSGVDVLTPDVYADDVPWDTLALLRRHAPVFRQTGIGDPRLVDDVWVVTTQEHVRAVSLAPEVFSSAANGVRLDRQRVAASIKVNRGNIIMLDPPEHRRQRDRIRKSFSPRVVRAFEDAYRGLAERIVDDAVRLGTFDVVESLALKVPIAAICTLLGLPDELHEEVRSWSDAVVGLDDPDAGGSREAAGRAIEELSATTLRIAAERRAAPRDDLLSQLACAEGEDRLDDDELCGFVLLLVVAGNETTRNATALGVEALARHPEQLDWLGEDPTRVSGAVEEILRWTSPLNLMARTALVDVELGGQQVRAGDRVAMMYGSANRDEAVFTDPDEFRLDRPDAARQVAFGVGGHACLGASLARVELAAVFGAVVERVAGFELAGPVVRLRSSWVRGVRSLPVRVRLR